MIDNFTKQNTYDFDAIVVGLGHAGVEAALALSRLGFRTLALSITLDNIGYLACNPSIGGTAKGHLVREIDALGGEMGIVADKVLSQLKMLNSSKGAAVHSLRAQVDKYKYHSYMKSVLENQENLVLRQGEVKDIIYEDNCLQGVRTVTGLFYSARIVIVATGVYLKSSIIIGDVIEDRGPVSFPRANYLSVGLENLGINLRRFKTGTPARVKRDTVDLSQLEVQEGELTSYTFSSLSRKVNYNSAPCYLGYTNLNTHDIIKDNLHRSPKYSGLIHGTGARYCPSIEDKIVRFADKERHQFFLEPEGDGTQEMYVQGLSTSLPSDTQLEIYRSIKGFEKVEIMRDAYAIEYDCIDPKTLYPTLEHKERKGLYFAGQIVGTSGYEEAAALGLMAGLNAAMKLKGQDGIVLRRDQAYIGVMIDDLVTIGADEPYRMMTSRAEFRLNLRGDNADLRLTPIGFEAGLVTKARFNRYKRKLKHIELAKSKLGDKVTADELGQIFGQEFDGAMSLREVIKRGAEQDKIIELGLFDGVDIDAVYEVMTLIKYEGYLLRQDRVMAEAARMENFRLSPDTDYSVIKGLRLEAKEKLNSIKPLSIGQASRISGVTPADINVLIIALGKKLL